MAADKPTTPPNLDPTVVAPVETKVRAVVVQGAQPTRQPSPTGPAGPPPSHKPVANVIANATGAATGSVAGGLIAAALGGPIGVVVGVAALGGIAAGFGTKKLSDEYEPNVLVRSDGMHWLIVKFHPGTSPDETLYVAIDRARQYAKTLIPVLYVGLRRKDVPGHPEVAHWSRRVVTDEYTAEWMEGANSEPRFDTSRKLPKFDSMRFQAKDGAEFLVTEKGDKNGPYLEVATPGSRALGTIRFPTPTRSECWMAVPTADTYFAEIATARQNGVL